MYTFLLSHCVALFPSGAVPGTAQAKGLGGADTVRACPRLGRRQHQVSWPGVLYVSGAHAEQL